MDGDPQFVCHGRKEYDLEIRFHAIFSSTKWNKVIIFALSQIFFFFLYAIKHVLINFLDNFPFIGNYISLILGSIFFNML